MKKIKRVNGKLILGDGEMNMSPQPIESAPKERTEYSPTYILAWMGDAWRIASWNDDHSAKRPRPYWDAVQPLGNLWSRAHQPKWWLPLPPPPPEAAGGES